MIHATIRIPALSLGHATEMVALLPEPHRFPPPWPTLWLLHGRSDDATAWTRHSTVERQADAFGMAIIMPSGYLSFYRDDQQPRGWESAFLRDLMPAAEAMFPLRRDRGGRAIAGLSMGGYGALWLGARHRHLFAAVSAHSPAVVEADRTSEPGGGGLRYFPDPLPGEETLLGALAAAPRHELPAIRIDCGDRDFLLPEARRLHAHLQAHHIAHEYAERQGGHDWMYWEKNIHSTLRFAATAFGRAVPP
jgi:S-formylglutathione hydrolase FrmB